MAAVNRALAKRGGRRLVTNLRPGRDVSAFPWRRIFSTMPSEAIATASAASPIQVRTHSALDVCCAVITLVARAVHPTRTMAQPGTAVKDEAPSIVSRMKRKLLIAAERSSGGSEGWGAGP